MKYHFEWDPSKALANRKKHKISFDEASTVFRNPLSQTWYDEKHSDEEDRHLIVGHSIRERVLVVSFTVRDRSLIRVISARAATPNECRKYEENEDFNH